jgi:beta-N-acetylhexosaminidase
VIKYAKKYKPNSDKFDLVMYLLTEAGIFYRNHVLVNWNKIGGMDWFCEEKPTIMVSLASPYHLYEFPRMKTLINAYSPFPIVQQEVVSLLIGEKEFKGTSPVDPYCGLFDAKL